MNSELRILILTPTALPTITGNAITAERWRGSLSKKGLVVKVLATQNVGTEDLAEQIRQFRPDLIHAHHAFRTGTLLLDPLTASECRHVPLVVSPSGTDINLDMGADSRRESIVTVCRTARVIVALGPEMEQRLRSFLPDLVDRIVHVPKAYSWIGQDDYDLRGAVGFQPGDFIFFLPAGVRPVKGNLECLAPMERVYSARPRSRIVFAGPELDPDYADRFQKQLKRLSAFARWVPSIPPQAMRSAYESADVVLNTSFSEGLSNVLIEAIAVGRPVLASNVPGNRWPVLGKKGDPPAGYLFNPHDPEDFVRHALNLIDGAEIREDFRRAAQWRAAKWPGPEAEAEGLVDAYKVALGIL